MAADTLCRSNINQSKLCEKPFKFLVTNNFDRFVLRVLFLMKKYALITQKIKNHKCTILG